MAPTYSPSEFYTVLLKEKERQFSKDAGGVVLEDEEAVRIREMKEFLKKQFKTDQIENIDYQQLKEALDGPSMLPRLASRKKVANMLSGKKDIVIRKSDVLRKEGPMATTIDQSKRNPNFGFQCLHYSVSEGSGYIEIMIINKLKADCSVGVRTVEGDAKGGEDYVDLDQILQFKSGQTELSVRVTINDDDEWEPDEDFYVELYDPNTKDKIKGDDTLCTVTIIDDDKPGTLSFENRSIKVVAQSKIAQIRVVRQNGCDGKIYCDYETIELD